ncbi:hypothetical protein [Yersinia phage vB_Yru_GN1]|uniref:Uncharacterized protein n=1 Tax=Yersinia phage vB_Yru_GN1 TaxID=3074381 RepID=A0AA86MC58_9CAUD|nr:hypothetical protein [Yersinia phage vB_Yru_GN1]
MKLNGVSPLEIRYDPNGKISYIKFLSIYDNTIVTNRKLNKYLKLHDKSVFQYILDINNLSIEDLPSCKYCSNRVIYDNKSGILNPKLKLICNSKECSDKFFSNARSKSAKLRSMNGTHNFIDYRVADHLTKDQLKLRNSKVNKSRIINGTHSIQLFGKLKYNGLNFKSKTELRIYLRYRRFLTKYYDREKSIGEYDKGKVYIVDYLLKPIYRDKNLPSIIEIKGGNLFRGLTKNTKLINYNKFKKVINEGLSILIIDDYLSNHKLIKLSTINQLNELFKL